MTYDERTAEHEAVHAALSRAFGVPVQELRVDQPTPGTAGFCAYAGADAWFPAHRWGGMALERIATAIGPELWFKHRRPRVYAQPALGCGSDQQRAAEVLDALFGRDDLAARCEFRRRAERRALGVLEDRHDEILEMAGQLAVHGGWSLSRGYGQPRAPWRRAVRPPGATPPAIAPVVPISRATGPSGPGGLFADLRRQVRDGALTWSEANAVATRAGFPSQIRGAGGERLSAPVGGMRLYADDGPDCA